MKTLLKIKKEMLDRGYSFRYVKIKRDKETNTICGNSTSLCLG